MPTARRVGGTLASMALVAAVAGCASGPNSAPGPGAGPKTLNIVAGENFWGSVVSQLAGRAGHVTSVVSDPNADPHAYVSNSDQARAFATADYVVLNGAGYDTWADKLLSGNPNRKRKVTIVADVLGKRQGDNPHFWYSPDYVTSVTDRVESDLKALAPAEASYFDAQRTVFDRAAGSYRDRLAAIRNRFAGTPVGSTESIFAYLATSLRLRLVSPPEFMQAIAEGNDPPAASVGQFQDQVAHRQIKVLVYNVQTATAVTSNIKKLAAQHHIPTVGISEAVRPPDASFELWQASQLENLQNALNGQVP